MVLSLSVKGQISTFCHMNIDYLKVPKFRFVLQWYLKLDFYIMETQIGEGWNFLSSNFDKTLPYISSHLK